MAFLTILLALKAVAGPEQRTSPGTGSPRPRTSPFGTRAPVRRTASVNDENYFLHRFGPEDTAGAVNYITPSSVLKDAKLIKTGKVYELAVTTKLDTPAFGTRTYKPLLTQISTGTQKGLGNVFPGVPLRYNEDMAFHSIGVGTHIDSFAHITTGFKSYNGFHQDDFMDPSTGLAKKLNSATIKPVVGRAVFLDFVKLLCGNGVDCEKDMLPGGHVITKQNIIDAVAAAKVDAIGTGDVVIAHTGWGSLLGTAEQMKYVQTQPGFEAEGCEYLGSRGVCVVGSDTFAWDVLPPPAGKLVFECHPILLNRYGVHILEFLNTTALAADGVKEFFFVLGVPKLDGTVQANVNPIGIV